MHKLKQGVVCSIAAPFRKIVRIERSLVLDCEQSLIFLFKVAARETHAREPR